MTEINPIVELAALVEQLVPEISPDQVAKLTAVIQAAQVNPPADTDRFVSDFNRLLSLFNLCLQRKDGELYRLRSASGADGRRHIQLAPLQKSGRSTQLKAAEVQIVTRDNLNRAVRPPRA